MAMTTETRTRPTNIMGRMTPEQIKAARSHLKDADCIGFVWRRYEGLVGIYWHEEHEFKGQPVHLYRWLRLADCAVMSTMDEPVQGATNCYHTGDVDAIKALFKAASLKTTLSVSYWPDAYCGKATVTITDDDGSNPHNYRLAALSIGNSRVMNIVSGMDIERFYSDLG
uniref:Uncharacterized protein n=1 Tax=viral metagenome TaxID=1070528 RepID=A0A6M3K1I3_9ZZZZ